MLSTPKPSFADSARRRRLSRWALVNAWKLSGLTALVTFVGFFVAIALSLLLRPTRSYFLPLLSDVDKHQPEGAILRLAFFISTALFFATTSASVLHYHTLCLLAVSVDRSVQALHPHPNAHAHASMDLTADDADVSEIVPSNPALSPRRRYGRFSTTSSFLLLSLITLIAMSTLQNPGLARKLAKLLRRIHVTKLLLNISFYLLVLTWMLAMSFLIWYFLKLQNMPDCPPPTLPSSSAAPPSTHHLNEDVVFIDDECSDDSDDIITPANPCTPPAAAHPRPLSVPGAPSHNIALQLRAFAAWFIVILRPVCLTGQAVCIIKIVGLWLALDTFSISNIRLVKIALLAALAFAEYMAALFFTFFMTILAVDMRSKAPSADMVLLVG